MKLDPQPDYRLFHHMAVVSPVAAMWYIIGLFKKKKKRGKTYKPPSLLYTKPTGTSAFYYLWYFLLKIKAHREKKSFQKLL